MSKCSKHTEQTRQSEAIFQNGQLWNNMVKKEDGP